MAVPFRSIPLFACALVSLSYSAPLKSVRADTCLTTDTCFESGQAEHCLKDPDDNSTVVLDLTENIVVLSAHGSSLELQSDHLSYLPSTSDSWSRYDFSDHGSATRAYWICG